MAKLSVGGIVRFLLMDCTTPPPCPYHRKKELQKNYVHYQLSFKLGPAFADEKEEANLYVPLGTCVVSPNTAGEEESNDNKTREIYVDNKEHELDNETVSVKENSGKKAI